MFKSFCTALLFSAACFCSFVVSTQEAKAEEDSFEKKIKELNIPDKYQLPEIVIGNENAPHLLIVYTSFSCAVCKKFHDVELPKLIAKYVKKGRLKIYLRVYLDDQAALDSAVLMRAFYDAKSKDSLKPYKIIFDNQSAWRKSDDPRYFLRQIFIDSGYDTKKIDKHLDLEGTDYKRLAAGLMKAMQQAILLGIKTAPSFIVDGKVCIGNLTADEIAKTIKLDK